MNRNEYLDFHYKIIIEIESTSNLSPQRFWTYHIVRKDTETPKEFTNSRNKPSKFKYATIDWMIKSLLNKN